MRLLLLQTFLSCHMARTLCVYAYIMFFIVEKKLLTKILQILEALKRNVYYNNLNILVRDGLTYHKLLIRVFRSYILNE